MKKIALFSFAIALSIYCSDAIAGGLNPIARGTQMATGDDAWSFSNNPANLGQFDEPYGELSARLVMPEFSYERFGKTKKSKRGEAHLMPVIGAVYPINEDLAIGLSVYVPFGMGTSFEENPQQLFQDTATMISATNIAPVISLKLSDSMTLGASLRICHGEIEYRAPYDIMGQPIPLPTDSAGDGWGVGACIGLLYEQGNFKAGVCYDSRIEVPTEGTTELSIGLLTIQDSFKSKFTFPERIGAGFVYRLNDKTRIAGDVNWCGYESAVNKMVMKFNYFPTKEMNMSWEDCWSFHGSCRRDVTEHLWAQVGVDYMTAAVTDTVSTLTTDVPGWDVSLKIAGQWESLSIAGEVIYAWGEQSSNSRLFGAEKYGAEVWVVGLSACWRF